MLWQEEIRSHAFLAISSVERDLLLDEQRLQSLQGGLPPGLPALSLPCGGAPLPVGMQLIGKAYDEATLLRYARAYEAATS